MFHYIFKNVLFMFCFWNTKPMLNRINNNYKSQIKNISKFTCYPNTQIKRDFSLFMKKNIKDIKNMSPVYKPKGPGQELYYKYLNDKKINLVFGIGPAGSGKTLFACEKAISELNRGNIQKIILTRPVVSVEEEIGFLPGSIVSKMDPWTKPIMDIFLEYYSQKDIQSMVNSNIIEIAPLAFMRGRTFKKSFIIADEMQNSSPNQMLMLITRIGCNSKMVITGDIHQSDRSKDNGLTDVLNKIKNYNKFNTTESIKLVELNSQDIERSEIVKQIIHIYDYNNNNSSNVDNLKIKRKSTTKKNKSIDEKDEKYEEKSKIFKKIFEINNNKNVNETFEFINPKNNNVTMQTNETNVNITDTYRKTYFKENDASLIPLSRYPRNDFTLF